MSDYIKLDVRINGTCKAATSDEVGSCDGFREGRSDGGKRRCAHRRNNGVYWTCDRYAPLIDSAKDYLERLFKQYPPNKDGASDRVFENYK